MLPSLKNDLFINISFGGTGCRFWSWQYWIQNETIKWLETCYDSTSSWPLHQMICLQRLVWVVRKEVWITLNRVVVHGGSFSRNTNFQGELLLGAQSGFFWSSKNHQYTLQHTSLKVLFGKLIDTSKFSWRK